MSYQNIINAPLFDFGDIKKSEITIKNTWNEFQAALANKTFKYDEVESAMTTTFLKVFDDLFANCCVRLERSLDIFQTDGYLARGAKLKALETVSYDRFMPKAEFINEQIEGRSIDLKCRLYRSKWIQSIAASDVMKFGQVVENPMIGAIPSRNEVQRELDDLLMSM